MGEWFCGGCGETNPQKRCIGCLHDMPSPTPDRIWATPSDASLDGGTYCNAESRPTAPNGDARLYVRDDPSPVGTIAASDVAWMVRAIAAADAYLDKGHHEMARSITRAALAQIKAVG